MSSGPPYDKKTLYHSDLVVATQSEPLAVHFNSEPQPSKFQGKDPWCGMQIRPPQGREHEFPLPEYTLNVENETVGAVISQNHSRWIGIRALGSREAAVLQVVGTPENAGNPQTQPPPPAAPASGATGQHRPQEEQKKGASTGYSFETSMRTALTAAQEIADDFFAKYSYEVGDSGQLEFVRLLGQSLFIQFHGQFKYQYVEMGGRYGPFGIADKQRSGKNGDATGVDGGQIASAEDVATLEELLTARAVPPGIEAGIRREIETGELTVSAAQMALDVVRTFPDQPPVVEESGMAPVDDLPF